MIRQILIQVEKCMLFFVGIEKYDEYCINDCFLKPIRKIEMKNTDLYICGPEAQLGAIKTMVYMIAERIGVQTIDESKLYIPVGIIMETLTGDFAHKGCLIGMETSDTGQLVWHIEMEDASLLQNALQEVFSDVRIA